MTTAEERISSAIAQRYFDKLLRHLSVDVVVVGAGPSGLVCARHLARAGLKVVIFESKLAPGGGIWGGGMLFNEIVVQEDALPILQDFGIRHQQASESDLFTADAVEVAAGLVFGALRAGATLFNAVRVEDLVFREDRVCGVVIQWAPVARLEMHVDPLMVMSSAVVDSTGHPSSVVAMATRKAGVRIETPTGEILGERPMWVDQGEASTVANTKRLYPGLYAAGMAANNVGGGFRMGPIFGGMLKSGRRAAELILEDLRA